MKSLYDIIKKKKTETDSPIEELLYQEFLKLNLKPVCQFNVGPFYIDLAFPEIKLAIEADGKNYHSNPEQILNDKYRQNRLESMGWKFERFTGIFLYKHARTAAGKIATKYLDHLLTDETRKIAIGSMVRYFQKQDQNIAINLVNCYLEIDGKK